MPRMTREEARQRRRERQSAGIDRSWMKYRECDLCGSSFCCNNYPDKKVRLVRWQGYVICATCRYKVLPAIQRLLKAKVLKIRKKKKRG